MATVAQLLRSPGPVIEAFLPLIQNLKADGDPFKVNEAAKIINDKMLLWGEGVTYETITNFPTAHVDQRLRNASESVLIKNFLSKMNSINLDAPNAWLEFQKFVDLFYKILDPITYFLNSTDIRINGLNKTTGVVPRVNFYLDRIGLYRRPVSTATSEGTGFDIKIIQEGDVTTKEQVEIYFRLPKTAMVPCPPPANKYCWDVAELNNRWFEMEYDGATGDKDVFWFDYNGTGVQPVVPGGGVVNYVAIAIADGDDEIRIQGLVDAAVTGTTHWVKVGCPPLPSSHPSCSGQPVSVYEADVVGSRTDAADGRGGYEELVTDMKASDGSTLASGLITDADWIAAHNSLRVPYEATLGSKIKYMKEVITGSRSASADGGGPCDNGSGPDCPCCDSPGSPNPCVVCYIALQTPAQANIDNLPVNAPGVVNNNSAGRLRIAIVDTP